MQRYRLIGEPLELICLGNVAVATFLHNAKNFSRIVKKIFNRFLNRMQVTTKSWVVINQVSCDSRKIEYCGGCFAIVFLTTDFFQKKLSSAANETRPFTESVTSWDLPL